MASEGRAVMAEGLKKTCGIVALVALVVILFAQGCSEKRLGPTAVGSHVIPGSEMRWHFVFQYKPSTEKGRVSADSLMYAVFWKGRWSLGVGSDHQHGVTTINGHTIKPDLERKAVYALQPDYTLRAINLADEEINRLFELHEAEDATFAESQVWQQKVAPQLNVVGELDLDQVEVNGEAPDEK
jgi:hypothetical protein